MAHDVLGPGCPLWPLVFLDLASYQPRVERVEVELAVAQESCEGTQKCWSEMMVR